MNLGGADNASIKMQNDFPNGLFISELFDDSNRTIERFLRKNYFENGAALFGRESPDELQAFREVCNGALDNISDEEVYGIIQFYVQRLKNYAHLKSLASARIKTARIIADPKPRTEMCKFYEGKIISVEEGLNTLEWLQTLSPKQQGEVISTKDFGFPPLYRLCRCTLEGLIRGVDY